MRNRCSRTGCRSSCGSRRSNRREHADPDAVVLSALRTSARRCSAAGKGLGQSAAPVAPMPGMPLCLATGRRRDNWRARAANKRRGRSSRQSVDRKDDATKAQWRREVVNYFVTHVEREIVMVRIRIKWFGRPVLQFARQSYRCTFNPGSGPPGRTTEVKCGPLFFHDIDRHSALEVSQFLQKAQGIV